MIRLNRLNIGKFHKIKKKRRKIKMKKLLMSAKLLIGKPKKW